MTRRITGEPRLFQCDKPSSSWYFALDARKNLQGEQISLGVADYDRLWGGFSAASDLGSCRVYLYDLFEHDESMPNGNAGAQPRALRPRSSALCRRSECLREQGRRAGQVRSGRARQDRLRPHQHEPSGRRDRGSNRARASAAPCTVIVLDDHGQLPCQAQQLAHREWFGNRGVSILESPTGQGIVIW
jgi:hypothetical protein